jgi:hypothetical protein
MILRELYSRTGAEKPERIPGICTATGYATRKPGSNRITTNVRRSPVKTYRSTFPGLAALSKKGLPTWVIVMSATALIDCNLKREGWQADQKMDALILFEKALLQYN